MVFHKNWKVGINRKVYVMEVCNLSTSCNLFKENISDTIIVLLINQEITINKNIYNKLI